MSEPLESGWLIERGDDAPHPRYFSFVAEPYKTSDGTTVAITGWAWTTDHLKAARFARKVDGEMCWRSLGRDLSEIRVLEHGWGGGLTREELDAVVAKNRRARGAGV